MKRVFTVDRKQLGSGPVTAVWQPMGSHYLAVSGLNESVRIYDRQGDLVDVIALSGRGAHFRWSHRGDTLAVSQMHSSSLQLWSAAQKKVSQMDASMKNITTFAWALKSDFLAAGTAKGNLIVIDTQNGKKVPVLGKHNRAITGVVWTEDNRIVCISDDKTFSVSSMDGDTLHQSQLSDVPSILRVQKMPQLDDNGVEKNQPVACIVLGGKALYMHSLNSYTATPLQLQFHFKYGPICDYEPVNKDQMLLAYSGGNCNLISINEKEAGKEIMLSKSFKENIGGMALCKATGKVAISGDGQVKICVSSDIKEVVSVIDFDEDARHLESVAWTEEGKFLAVTSNLGNLYVYLAAMPSLGDAKGAIAAWVSSLSEISVCDYTMYDARNSFQKLQPKRFTIDIEPQQVFLGKSHVAVCNDCTLAFYKIPTKQASSRHQADFLSFKKLYKSTVVAVSLNNTKVFVQTDDGTLLVENLTSMAEDENPLHRFPSNIDHFQQNNAVVVCHATTEHFLIIGYSTGMVQHVDLEEWTVLNEYCHQRVVQSIYQEPDGTKMIFTDIEGQSMLYNPSSGVLLPIPNSPGIKSVALFIWDTASTASNVFYKIEENSITAHAFVPNHVDGSIIELFDKTQLPSSRKPLLFMKGIAQCISAGRMVPLAMESFEEAFGDESTKMAADRQLHIVRAWYLVGMLPDLIKIYPEKRAVAGLRSLASVCLQALDVTSAILIYRHLKNAAMVMLLEKLKSIEDKSSLAGFVSLIVGNFDVAQDHFLAGAFPMLALELRCDLRQWQKALMLSESLSPSDVPVLCRDYAQQLEMDGQYSEALGMYKRALAGANELHATQEEIQKHEKESLFGHIRVTFRLGNIANGNKLLDQIGEDNRQLFFECGSILEQLKQFYEAAVLFERGQYWERAAEGYLKSKSLGKFSAILSNVKSPRLHLEYGAIKEAQQQFEEAATAYEKAHAYNDLVRVYVNHLDRIEDAVRIVRSCKSRDAAKMVADFFVKIGDLKSVVEFYILADMKQQAMNLAQQSDLLDFYAELLGDDVSPDELLAVARHFEGTREHYAAGKYFLRCGRYTEALSHFLRCNDDSRALELAIETVGLAKSDTLTHELINHLMVEGEGVSKDPKYIFKLYMSLGQFKEAARTALIIAREEWASGNYRPAHDLLLDTHKRLIKHDIHISMQLDTSLMLLHSYVLVKIVVKNEDHYRGAKLLVRISNNISKFPAHAIQILTSTVIECQRAGLKKLAFEFAAILMRPENRNRIDAKHKRKIEMIIRRPETENIAEQATPCTFCGYDLEEYELDCPECKNTLPYCIASGAHMILDQWTECAHCRFPANIKAYTTLTDVIKECPMCGESIGSDSIELSQDPKDALNRWRGKRSMVD